LAQQLKIKELRAVIQRPQPGRTTDFMAATGELIRLINYVDDINTTLRRIQASLYGVDADERKRLAESLRAADAHIRELLAEVEK
jgi:hypothetical protein